jgi:LmbE family N-acetylglucosaminyl deacetylase
MIHREEAMQLRHLLTVLLTLALLPSIAPGQGKFPSKADTSMYKPGYDLPVNVPHGTWDFDEWPGVDHRVVYKSSFNYNSAQQTKIKIDYFMSVFDADDHEGYLKTPQDLTGHGFEDMGKVLAAKNRRNAMVAVFTHPDDDILLAGGLLSYAKMKGWDVHVILVSNGADGGAGITDGPDDQLGGYNCAGIMGDGKVRIGTDRTGLDKLAIIRSYSDALGVPVEVLKISLQLDGKSIVQIGEYPGLDFTKTFAPDGPFSKAIATALTQRLAELQPAVILTHGTNGEYGNLLHIAVSRIVTGLAEEMQNTSMPALFTCFPEYNVDDTITHFLDLDRENGKPRANKFEALRRLTFLYKTGTDYDKPWDPNDNLMDGAFVKDYGYTPVEGRPPRYEFFSRKLPKP